MGGERVNRRGYRLYAGEDLSPGDPHYADGTFAGLWTGEIVVNRLLAEAEGVSVGDRLQVSASFNAALRLMNAPRPGTVRGLADFRFDLHRQYSVALHTSEVQDLAGQTEEDRAAMIVVKLRDPDRTEAVVEQLTKQYPQVTVYSIGGYLRQLETQLFYFKQFARLLSSVSLIVTFLLVVSIVTISFNERLGEMAILRAIGFPPRRVAAMVWSEGWLLAVASILPALALGLAVSYPLNAVLSQSPSLPQDLRCLVFTPRAAGWTSLLLLATGSIAGLYPAWRAARLRIGETLHREIV
jgi:putative ABC transport system permease protein